MIRRCLIYGKKNCEGPDGWEENDNLPWYDPKKKYGVEIPGALVNGYTAEEMDTFWKSILGFASYAFNASHSVAYAYISYLMAWLKYYYPTQFFTAVLTMTSDDEKRKNYIRLAEDFADTKTLPPDINKSNEGFTCDAEHKTIYYGLASIKGVGATSYKTIIANRPYTSLQDIFDKVPKKAFNKSVGIALIKSGALDSFDPNRLELLKEFYTIRKDKVEDFDTSAYNDDMSIAMERETLGINLSHKTWWESIPRNKKIEVDMAFVMTIKEHTDKRGRLMAFLELSIEGCSVNAIVFASTYSRYQAAFKNIYGRLSLVGKKDDKDELIIDKATSLVQNA